MKIWLQVEVSRSLVLNQILKQAEQNPFFSPGVVGSHIPHAGIISLSCSALFDIENDQLKAGILHLVTHECLHAITAGKVVEHNRTRTLQGKTTNIKSVGTQWSGLSAKTSDSFNPRFSWLNEALTEWISATSLQVPVDGYVEEIELMELLLHKGKKMIEIRTLANAYFESKGLESDTLFENKDGKHTYWNTFRDAIRESFDHDPQFLIKLDIMVQNEGTGKAIEFLQNWDPEKPAAIDIKKIEVGSEERNEKAIVDYFKSISKNVPNI